MKVYILMGDSDGTTFSSEKPCGVTSSKERAKQFVADNEGGYTSSFEEHELEE